MANNEQFEKAKNLVIYEISGAKTRANDARRGQIHKHDDDDTYLMASMIFDQIVFMLKHGQFDYAGERKAQHGG